MDGAGASRRGAGRKWIPSVRVAGYGRAAPEGPNSTIEGRTRRTRGSSWCTTALRRPPRKVGPRSNADLFLATAPLSTPAATGAEQQSARGTQDLIRRAAGPRRPRARGRLRLSRELQTSSPRRGRADSNIPFQGEAQARRKRLLVLLIAMDADAPADVEAASRRQAGRRARAGGMDNTRRCRLPGPRAPAAASRWTWRRPASERRRRARAWTRPHLAHRGILISGRAGRLKVFLGSAAARAPADTVVAIADPVRDGIPDGPIAPCTDGSAPRTSRDHCSVAWRGRPCARQAGVVCRRSGPGSDTPLADPASKLRLPDRRSPGPPAGADVDAEIELRPRRWAEAWCGHWWGGADLRGIEADTLEVDRRDDAGDSRPRRPIPASQGPRGSGSATRHPEPTPPACSGCAAALKRLAK